MLFLLICTVHSVKKHNAYAKQILSIPLRRILSPAFPKKYRVGWGLSGGLSMAISKCPALLQKDNPQENPKLFYFQERL